MGVGYLQEVMLVLFMGVKDHQEVGTNLWEEVVDLQAKADPELRWTPKWRRNFKKRWR
jgi:hypothetical protein